MLHRQLGNTVISALGYITLPQYTSVPDAGMQSVVVDSGR